MKWREIAWERRSGSSFLASWRRAWVRPQHLHGIFAVDALPVLFRDFHNQVFHRLIHGSAQRFPLFRNQVGYVMHPVPLLAGLAPLRRQASLPHGRGKQLPSLPVERFREASQGLVAYPSLASLNVI